jgi:sulfate adenylyltransferase
MNKIITTALEFKFDARLISWGVFGALDGFMSPRQWEQACLTGVVEGQVVGLPMTLPLGANDAQSIGQGQLVDLAEPSGMVYASMRIEGVFKIDPQFEAKHSLGTLDPIHPWLARLNSWSPWRAFGRIEHFKGDLGPDPFRRWLSPQETKAVAKAKGWSSFAAMQTRNPLHGAHLDLIQRAMQADGVDGVLVHPAMGLTKPGDLSPEIRARCYEAAMASLPLEKSMLGYAPLAMRMAGPREALWHARIRKGFGASAFIVGRDHAGPGNDSSGRPFYEPQASAILAKEHAGALGMQILAYQESVYSPRRSKFVQPHELEWGEEPLSLSGTDMRSLLLEGKVLPSWFTPSAVARELSASRPAGVGILLTGLSAAGKSMLAQRLAQRWMMSKGEPMTILDGDEARKMLSSELGFSREHRDLNVLRLGFVAAEVAKHGGAAVIAAIAPFEEARNAAADLIAKQGIFCLVHVSTSLSVCESRDPKGLYAKARSGELKGFTGIDDPYEKPLGADLVLDMNTLGLDEACEKIEECINGKRRAS